MKNIKTQNTYFSESKTYSPLTVGLFLWGVIFLVLFAIYWVQSDESFLGEYYLLPWSFLAGIVTLAPCFYLWKNGKFDLFHPLVFGSLSYVFPAFVIGGILLAFNWTKPYFFSLIEDPQRELPLSLIYVCLGFCGLAVGYYLPVSKYLTNKINGFIPELNWNKSYIWFGGIILLIIGFGVNIWGMFRGILGYQVVDSVDQFDGVLRFLIIILSEGTVLLWLIVFNRNERKGLKTLLLILLLVSIPVRVAMLGSKASIVMSLLPIIFAFNYSGRQFKFKHGAIFAVLITVGLIAGIIYGTSFRNIKGSEARIDVGDYFGQVNATVEYLSTADVSQLLEEAVSVLAERVENLSSLAVVVSNYEKLAPYEAAYGLENNIINDTVYSLIPRFLWLEKPVTSDARAYSDLYFNFGETSYAISPFGDLLRNFGVIGIPIGMAILGIYLRMIYGVLIETDKPAMWKTMAYFQLLTVISYEGFYATLFPSITRVLIVVIISVVVLNFILKKREN